jgi:hypothetical protein
MDYCPNCGAQVPEGNAFCNECGARVGGVPQSTPDGGYLDPYAAPVAQGGSGGGMATASLVLGVASVVMSLLSCVPFVSYCTCIAVPVMALIGVILGFVGISNPAGKGQAIWGIVLNILAVVICIALVVLYALGLVTLSVLQES